MPDPVELVIKPRSRDLGGFEVARVLPYVRRRSVGPFIFFDCMGPNTFGAGEGIDVRPHPHIGLATVTYLFEGEIMHRDSLGYEQPIRPGDVNWMTAGRGIVHSERTRDEIRNSESRLFGIQSWVALPKNAEESDPGFFHHPENTLPEIENDGVRMRMIAGTAYGANEMLVLAEDTDVTFTSANGARVMLLGGAPIDGERHLWWNFVSSSGERLEQAKDDWKNNRFDRIAGDDEFIPLPEK